MDAGDIFSGALDLGQWAGSSALNWIQADRNRNFQQRLSNTSHQREVSDLKAAGLNPILSSKYGGSSTPSGSSAQIQTPDAVGKALQSAQTRAQINLANSNSALAMAQAGDVNMTQQQRIDLLIAQKRQALQNADATDFGKVKTSREIDNLEQQKQLLLNQTKHSAYDLDRAKNESTFEKGVGVGSPLLNKGLQIIKHIGR